MVASRSQSSLQRFVPRIAADWDQAAGGRLWQEVDGTLCMLDLSGFTALSERLARRGRIGAEELTDVLNRVFGEMLKTGYDFGGSLLKFGGDALLLMFTGDDHAVRAASATVAMRSALRLATSEPTSVGKIRLRMSVGVHSGRIHLFCVGNTHRELIVTGPAGTMTTMMEHEADAGEILVSSATRDMLPRGAVSGPKGAGWLLRWRKPVVAPGTFDGRSGIGDERMDQWLPTALRSYLAASAPEPEHRVATVGFVRYCGLDQVLEDEGPASVADGLHALMSVIQAAADAEGVTFLATDINEDGGKVLLVAGAPTVREDDEGHLLRAVRRIADAEAPFDLHIGVDRGHVFAGEVGTDYRSTYTVMGDTVNTAARLCGAAWAGRIYSTPNALERSRSLFETEQLEPLTLKGKADPLIAYSVGNEAGFRSEAARSDTPFVGRVAELAYLNAALGSKGGPADNVVAIVGETGVGKSRLIDEVLLTHPEARVVELRAEPYGTGNPYRSLRDPLRSVLGIERDSQPAMAEALRLQVELTDPSVIPLIPLLGDVMHIEVESTPDVDGIEPRFRRDRLADTVLRILGRLIEASTVFVVDDAHWMDEASAHLLERLAATTEDHSWRMLVSRRPSDDGFTPGIGTVIDLEPLTETEAEQLVIAFTSAAPLRPHEVDAIVTRAGGNPLFLEETMRVVRETGGVEALPDSLGAVVGARIDALPPLARRILRYASVLGQSFRVPALRDLLGDDHATLDAATRRELAGFLDSEGRERLVFRHAIVRDVAYDGLSFRRRRELHLRAAAAIERGASGHVEDVADLLATHYSLGADHQRAWKFSRMAGDRAKATYANVEAATNYERALEAARRLGNVAAEDRAAIWVDLGDVLEPVGLFNDALAAYRRASQLLKGDPVARAGVQFKRAVSRERAGAYRQALREITAGYRMLENLSTPAAAKIRARLAAHRGMIRQAQERPREALDIALRAVEAASVAVEPHAEGAASMVVHWAHLMLGLPGGASYGQRAVALFRDLDEPENLAVATNLLGADAYFAGDWDDAVAQYEQGRSAASRAGNVVQAALIGSNIGEVLVNQGRFDEAEPVLRDAARVQRASGYLEGAADMRLGRLLTLRGSLEEAEQILKRTHRDFTDLGLGSTALEAQMDLARCWLAMERVSLAEDTLRDIADHAGEDFIVLGPTLSRYRVEAFVASHRWDDARAEVQRGIALATAQGLDYEWALLVLMHAALEERVSSTVNAAHTAEAHQLLVRLGVRDPSLLLLGVG